MQRRFVVAALLGVPMLGMLLFATGVQSSGTPAQRLANLEQQFEQLQTKLQGMEQRIASLEAGAQIATRDVEPAGRPAVRLPDRAKAVSIRVTNKRFVPRDVRSGRFEEGIYWDAEYRSVGLAKPTRAIKGVVVFADIFGEPKMRISVTVNDSLSAAAPVRTTNVGIDYNQFMNEHQWLRSTDLTDMMIWFEIESVIYADGTRAEFRN